MLFLHHRQIFRSAKVVILLEKNGIVLVLIKVQNGFEVLLVEIFVLELFDNDVSFFCFSKSSKEDVEVVLYLFG